MAQSLAKILVHLVYSTEDRQPLIHDGIRDELHRYTAAMLIEMESPKKKTSKWIKRRDDTLVNLYWQNGYGAFSINQSTLSDMKRYIANQLEHHKALSFQDEFRAFLKRYEISNDKRYVWD